MTDNIIKEISCQEELINNKSIFNTKIRANLLAYKNHPSVCKFWQGDASYCFWGDNLTIDGKAEIDFVKFIKPKTVLSSLENAKFLDLKIITQGQVMTKHLQGQNKQLNAFYPQNLKSVYNLLKSCDMAENYEDFLLDTSHKLRHGLGALATIEENEKLIAVALASYVCENSALISAVAVDKNYRNRNFGTEVVEKLEEKLLGKTIFLFKEKDKNDHFYLKQNYEINEKWCIGELK